jgi:4-hydroxy-2-oxoglutarate aldolase
LQVAENSSLPLILYNVPVYTDVKLSPEIIARIAQHPNIIGLKNSLSDYNHFISVFDRVDQDFQVLTGNASILLETFRLGSRGGILAAAAVSPDLCVQLYQEFIGQGRTSKLDKLQSRIKEINELVIIKYGVPGIKYVLDKNDYFGGDPRLPLLPLHEDDKFKLNFILR